MAPTIIIVPGSFAPVSLYNNFLQVARAAGLSIDIISTPSVGRKPEGQAPGTMADDVSVIVAKIEPLLDEGKEVILLTHSYGGVPGTQSLEILSKKQGINKARLQALTR